ncbi:MAG: potassium channel family protein [Sphingomonadales bacterium]|jgi:uncharacterized membrane protein|nr:potassium channel family protein [Sphingomonadales bacterium]MEA3048401.1 potassium channel family protein [Sphingomonadales bacterium]
MTSMSDVEGLAEVRGVNEHIARHSLDRLIMLSDGVFAIAITLAALDVHLPNGRGALLPLLAVGSRSLLAYTLSFGIAGIFWVNHRNLFARLRRVDAFLTVLTLTMLCLIALVPATIRTLYADGAGTANLRIYGLTMFACSILNMLMWWYASLRRGLMLPNIPREERQARAALTASLPILFLPVLLMPMDSFAFAMLPIAVVVILGRRVLLARAARHLDSA